MADISKIKIESGVYDIKDEVARENLQILNEKIKNVSKFPNFFIGAFFHGGFGTVEKSTAHFYSSIDGVNFSEFSSNINTMTDNWFRDLSFGKMSAGSVIMAIVIYILIALLQKAWERED